MVHNSYANNELIQIWSNCKDHFFATKICLLIKGSLDLLCSNRFNSANPKKNVHYWMFAQYHAIFNFLPKNNPSKIKRTRRSTIVVWIYEGKTTYINFVAFICSLRESWIFASKKYYYVWNDISTNSICSSG